MRQWKQMKWLHIIISIGLLISIGIATLSGMLIHATREYAGQDYKSADSTFYVSQKQFENLLDGYLRIYEQYMEIGSIIAPDGLIDYDTELMVSATDPSKKYTLKELLHNAKSTGMYAAQFREFMDNIAEFSAQGESYLWKTQFQMDACNRAVVDDGDLFLFTNYEGSFLSEGKLNNAKRYIDNMILIDSISRNFIDQLQGEMELTIPDLNGMKTTFSAASSYEKYLITYYRDYAKWYYLNNLTKKAKNTEGGWSEDFKKFYQQYKKAVDDPVSIQKVYKILEDETEVFYKQIPEEKIAWDMHKIPRSLRVATDYAAFLVETYQEMKYLFSESNFTFAYQDSKGMLLTNDEAWWNQVRQQIQRGLVEKGNDQDRVLFSYYDTIEAGGDSNLQTETLEMSGGIQEKLLKIGEDYQKRSFRIAVGVNLERIRQGTLQDSFSRQYMDSRQKAMLSEHGNSLFLPFLLMGMICLAVLFLCCGHQTGTEEIVLNWFDYIWVELIVICVLFLGQVYAWLLKLWNGSLVQIELALTWTALVGMGSLAAVVFVSFVKRLKAQCFWKQSFLLLVLRDIFIKRLKLRDVWHHLQEIYWKLPLRQRYITLFLIEILIQVYFVGLLVWIDLHQNHQIGRLLRSRYGILSLMIYLAGILYIAIWQMRCYYNGKVNQMIIQETRQIAEGEFSHQIEKPLSVSHEQQVLIDLLNQIGVRFEEAVDQSVRNERLKTELIANVSHDIKTPLTSVINYVDLMKRQPIENEQLQSYVDVLDRKSHRLKTLIEDLIEASKASSGAMELHLGTLNFSELILQTNGEFEDYFQEADLELVSEIPEEALLFVGDGRRVYRILENLYMNARKYAVQGTRVYVKLDQIEEQAVFSISNVSAAKLNITPEELTERFVRGDSSRTTEGSGLGLSIAKNLTELMHGQFQIYLDGDWFRAEVAFPLGEELKADQKLERQEVEDVEEQMK